MISSTASSAVGGPQNAASSSSRPKQQKNITAFLELIKNMPPASIDGLLGLVSDLRHRRQYTEQESRAMRSCESVQALAMAIRKCEGLHDQVLVLRQQQQQRQRAWQQSGRSRVTTAASGASAHDETRHNSAADQAAAIKQQKERLQRAANRYMNCLSFHTCPSQWRTYSSCWSSLGGLTMEQATELHRIGVVCQRERIDLERCVGNQVSNAVRRVVELRDNKWWGWDD